MYQQQKTEVPTIKCFSLQSRNAVSSRLERYMQVFYGDQHSSIGSVRIFPFSSQELHNARYKSVERRKYDGTNPPAHTQRCQSPVSRICTFPRLMCSESDIAMMHATVQSVQ